MLVIGLITEFLGELFLQFLFQCLFEFILQTGFGNTKPKTKWSKLIQAIGLTFFGVLLGLMSIALVPHHFLKTEAARWINLFATPILLGLFMRWRGEKLTTRGKRKTTLDSFWMGFLFAFAFALVRLSTLPA